MVRPSWKLAILIAGIIVLAGSAVMLFLHRSALVLIVRVDNLEAISPGDKLYMSGYGIGEVDNIQLSGPGQGTIRVEIYDKYKAFVNSTAVFTISEDRRLPGHQCMLVKNCQQDAPLAEAKQVFSGYGRFSYEFACLTTKSSDVWDNYLRKNVEKAIAATDKLTNETIENLKAYKAEHQEEFKAWIERMQKEIDNLTPQIKSQLNELNNGSDEDKKNVQ